jgi:hypothetical protein
MFATIVPPMFGNNTAVKKDVGPYLSDIVFVLSGRHRGVYGGYPGGILREGKPGLT